MLKVPFIGSNTHWPMPVKRVCFGMIGLYGYRASYAMQPGILCIAALGNKMVISLFWRCIAHFPAAATRPKGRNTQLMARGCGEYGIQSEGVERICTGLLSCKGPFCQMVGSHFLARCHGSFGASINKNAKQEQNQIAQQTSSCRHLLLVS